MENIYSLTLEDMEKYFLSNGSKKFHAKQLFEWLYVKRIKSIDEATTISCELKNKKLFKFSLM